MFSLRETKLNLVIFKPDNDSDVILMKHSHIATISLDNAYVFLLNDTIALCCPSETDPQVNVIIDRRCSGDNARNKWAHVTCKESCLFERCVWIGFVDNTYTCDWSNITIINHTAFLMQLLWQINIGSWYYELSRWTQHRFLCPVIEER